MSRVFWFAAGAASGVYGVVKAKRTARNFTPDGVAARLAAWNVGARMFKDEVASGMAEREHQLREQLSLDAAAQQRLIDQGPAELGRSARDARATEAAAAASDSPRAS
jgi:uncharacterized protein DUF6167